MTEQERDKAINKLEANSELIKDIPCTNPNLVADFTHFETARIRIPDTLQNRILKLIYTEYQNEIANLEKVEIFCADKKRNDAVIYSWQEALEKAGKE